MADITLFMSGGGDSEYYQSLDRHFLDTLEKQSNLLLIPVANDPSEYDDCLDRVRETFEGKKVSQVEMVSDLSKLDLDRLMSFDAVYIDGGNTFALIDQIRSSNFAQDYKKFVEEGGIGYGDSAGAIIMGSRMETAFIGEDGDDNIASLQSFHALDLLDPWAIHCHYETPDDEQSQDFVYNNGVPLIAIAEPTGIAINNEEVQVHGSHPLILFTFEGKKSFNPGSTFNLAEQLGG